MVISADFEKQKQYFVKKIIALSQYRFITILLAKIARLTRALERHVLFEWPFSTNSKYLFMFQIFVDYFGKELYNFMIVLFTGAQDLERDGISIGQFVKDSPSNLKEVLNFAKNRYIAFSNRYHLRNFYQWSHEYF